MTGRKPKLAILEPPENLSKDERAIWLEKAAAMAAQGMTPAEVDAGLLEFYSVSMCEARRAQNQVQQGLIVSSQKDKEGKPDTKYAQPNPYLKIAKKAYADAVKAETALMKKAAAKRAARSSGEEPPPLVTRRELAHKVGHHMQTVTKWEQSGMPVAEPGRKGKPSLYSEPEVRKWLAEREEAARKNGTLDVAHERARKEKAQAILAEQTVAIRAKDLFPRGQAERAWAAEVAAVRAKLLAWPSTISDRLYRESAVRGVKGVERVVKEAVEGLLRELSDPQALKICLKCSLHCIARAKKPRGSGRRKK